MKIDAVTECASATDEKVVAVTGHVRQVLTRLGENAIDESALHMPRADALMICRPCSCLQHDSDSQTIRASRKSSAAMASSAPEGSGYVK